MENISFTIPLERDALTRVSDMLHGMVLDLDRPTNAPVIENIAASSDQDQSVNVDPVVTDIINHEPMEMDAEGVRWDQRIHVDSRAKLKKSNTWRLKKKIDPSLVDQIKAEQSNQVGFELKVGSNKIVASPMTIQTPVAPATVAPAPFAPAPVAPAPVAPAPVAPAPVAPAPVAPAPATVAPAPVAPAPVADFASLMTKITQRQTERPEFGADITSVLAEFNVASLPALIPMTDTIPLIDARLDQLWQG